MKLRSGKILGLCCLNVRMLRSGREIPTLPAKPALKIRDVVNRVRFTAETRFNERVGGLLDKSDEFELSKRQGATLKRWIRRFKTVLEYCRYMDG